jgi:hypothetical protein
MPSLSSSRRIRKAIEVQEAIRGLPGISKVWPVRSMM